MSEEQLKAFLEKVKADTSLQEKLKAAADADAVTAIAKEAGVERIIYLGGLGNEKEVLSSHLRSRQEVGYILRASNVPVTEFRASIVIGSGSLSFEMIKSLVERLPIMLIPKWAPYVCSANCYR